MKYRVGIDLGGTSAKIAVVDDRHYIKNEISVSSSGFPRPAEFIEKLALVCRSFQKSFPFSQIGVGVAGDIDSGKGLVRVSPNLGWKNVPLGPLLRKKISARVVVDNDANAAAWGLYKTQVSPKVKNLAVVTLGTGVGGGLILEGKLYRGTTGSAGEIGHLNIDVNGPMCNCGNRGCLETYVGGPHLIKKVLGELKNRKKSSLSKIVKKDPVLLTPQVIAAHAKKGDALSLSIWNQVGWALGIGLGDFIYLFNPELICFTGGISQAGSLILKPLMKTLKQRAFQTPVQAAQIKIANHAPHVGVIGASLLE